MSHPAEVREATLRSWATCGICHKPFGSTGAPIFYRATMTGYVVDLAAVSRSTGLAMALSPALAMAMGPDEVLARRSLSVEITVCAHCAALSMPPVVDLLEGNG